MGNFHRQTAAAIKLLTRSQQKKKNPTAKFRALKIPQQPKSKVSAVRSDETDKKLPELLLDTKKPCSDAEDTFGLFRVRLEKQHKDAGGSDNTNTRRRSAPKPHSGFFAPVRYPVIRR